MLAQIQARWRNQWTVDRVDESVIWNLRAGETVHTNGVHDMFALLFVDS